MARQNRAMKVFSSVASGATVNTDSSVIPNGQQIQLTVFGASDVNIGDNKSATVQLQFGSGATFTTLWALGVTGTPYEKQLTNIITGDGTSFIRLVRTNNSASAKNIGAWLEGFDL